MSAPVEAIEAVKVVVADAYEDGIQAATAHGFEEVYQIQRTEDQYHYIFTWGGGLTKHLTDRDLGHLSGHAVRLSQVGDFQRGDVLENLEFLGGRSPIIIEKGVLLKDQRDLVGIMFGVVPAIGPIDRGFHPDYYMRLGFGHRSIHAAWKEDKVISLGEAVKSMVARPFVAEVAGRFGNRVFVTAPGAEFVPGLITPFVDNSWLLTNGREALAAVINDVFVMRERFHHLQSFGLQSR